VPVLVCHCACPDQGTAEAIASCLVEERLAACVQILPPTRSVYRWDGRVEHASEVLLLAKTGADRLEALCARIRALHPYETPEVLALEAVGGSPAYLDWIRAETRDGAAA
jgi:periplasmic divalent cation tolerance protein